MIGETMNNTIKTITEQIYQEIRNSILEHRISAGEKLTVKMLHEKYGVSSSPIREALTRLQQDGLIEYKPNSGMSVVRLTKKDLDEIFSLMVELDVIAMKHAANSKDKTLMLDNLDKLQKNIDCISSDSNEWKRLSDDFHLIFYHFANNQRLTDAACKLRLQFTILSNAYEEIPSNRSEINKEHKLILSALQKNDLLLAEKLFRDHIYSSYTKACKYVPEN